MNDNNIRSTPQNWKTSSLVPLRKVYLKGSNAYSSVSKDQLYNPNKVFKI